MLEDDDDRKKTCESSVSYNLACRRILEYSRSELGLCATVLYHQQNNTGLAEFVAGYIPGIVEGQANKSLNVVVDAVHTGRCAFIVSDISQSAYQQLKVFPDNEPVSIVAFPISEHSQGHRSILCGISMMAQNRRLGDQQSMLEFCVQQIKHAVSCYSTYKDNLDVIEYLTKQAYRDTLTGLLNRNGWEDAIASAVANRFGSYRCLSVFVIDVDDLKQLNDTQGHSVGDDAIRQVALVLQEYLVPENSGFGFSDLSVLARTGGDEFMGLLFGCNDEEAQALISKIKEELSFFSISISIGSSSCGSAQKLAEAIVNADEAMYLQKKLTKAERAAELLAFKNVS